MTKILGAGLSGLTTAVKLAESGANVTVSEQTGGPSRFYECAQAVRNYESKKDFADVLREKNLKTGKLFPVKRIVKYGPSMKTQTTYSNNGPIFYTIKRGKENGSIDAALFQQATDAGVKIELNQRCSTRDCDVIATGPFFITGVGAQTHFKDLKTPVNDIHFFLNNDFAPQGYACVIPYAGNEATVLVTVFDELSYKETPKLLERFLKENAVVSQLVDGATRVNTHNSGVFYNVPETALMNGKYFVGDGIGFVEAARGFGVRYAIESGALAAQAISTGADYDALWKESFGFELLESFKRRLAMQRMSNADYDYLINAEKPEINIEEYVAQKKERSTHFLKSFLIDKYVELKLKEWRARYDISKLV